MEHSRIIHTYMEQKVEPFWWIFYQVVLSTCFLFGVALILGPFYILLKYQVMWLLLFFLFIPLGIWISKSVALHMKKLRWHNNHLSSYTLFEDKIETVEWTETYSQSPTERVIPINSISSIIASYYIIRQTLTQNGVPRKITETGPILYIIYVLDGDQRVVNIPFPTHGDQGINSWFAYFRDLQLPIKYTARQLYRIDMRFLDDQQRLEYFETTNELVDFPFSESWLTDEPKAWEAWKEVETQQQVLKKA